MPSLFGDASNLFGDMFSLFGEVSNLFAETLSLFGEVPSLLGEAAELCLFSLGACETPSTFLVFPKYPVVTLLSKPLSVVSLIFSPLITDGSPDDRERRKPMPPFSSDTPNMALLACGNKNAAEYSPGDRALLRCDESKEDD